MTWAAWACPCAVVHPRIARWLRVKPVTHAVVAIALAVAWIRYVWLDTDGHYRGRMVAPYALRDERAVLADFDKSRPDHWNLSAQKLHRPGVPFYVAFRHFHAGI